MTRREVLLTAIKECKPQAILTIVLSTGATETIPNPNASRVLSMRIEDMYDDDLRLRLQPKVRISKYTIKTVERGLT